MARALGEGYTRAAVRRWVRRLVLFVVFVDLPVTLAGTLAIYHDAFRTPETISRERAIAVALQALPDHGSGFSVSGALYEPPNDATPLQTSWGKNRVASWAGQQRECYSLNAFPMPWPCRYYPSG